MTDTHTTTLVRAELRDVAAERMHPLVAATIGANVAIDPATMRELLAVQREWEAGEAKKAYTRAKAALKRDLPTVLSHDRLVDYPSKSGGTRTRYTHTSLAAVMDAVTEPLTRHGFELSWTPTMSDRVVRVTCRLTHAEGHAEEASLEAPADSSGNKSPAQAIASTATLLSRYTALMLLGIATADMQEDTGEREPPSEDTVDAKRNLRAAAAVVRAGRTREEAEAHIGRPVSAWTLGDLSRLRAWLGIDEGKAREPGEDG